jgi:protein involved in temperature-dependent protein secretion
VDPTKGTEENNNRFLTCFQLASGDQRVPAVGEIRILIISSGSLFQFLDYSRIKSLQYFIPSGFQAS